MKESTRRILLGGGIPFVLAAVGLGPYLAYRSDLPDRVATHFDGSGTPDGSMTPEQFLMIVGGLMAIGLGACMGVALTRRKLQPMVAPGISSIGAFVAALCGGILAITAIDQRGLERWQDARLSPSLLIVLVSGSVIVACFAAWIASSLPYNTDPDPDAEPPAMELSQGERAFWSSTVTVRWPLLLGLVALGVALFLTQVTGLWIVMIVLLSGLSLTFFGRIRVTADRTGLRVRYGLLGWPRTSVPISRIALAQAIDIRPAEWGGWGYRGSLTLMRRAAVVLRAGPGIRLDLRDGRVFAVTVDDPDDPVRLLNAEVSRLAPPQSGS